MSREPKPRVYKSGRLSLTCMLFGHRWVKSLGVRTRCCERCGARAIAPRREDFDA